MITITGASGRLGRHVLDTLLLRGVEPSQILALVHTQGLDDYAARGVAVRSADYDDPASLTTAFADVDRLLFISSSAFGHLPAQHRNVVEAATAAGASEIVYTSFLNADTSGITMAEPHVLTEALIRDSGVPFAILRNGSYIENYTGFIGFWMQYRNITASAGDGRFSGAAIGDLAQAAAVIVSGDPVAGQVYELGGPAYTMADLAAEASTQTGVPIVYQDVPVEQYAQILATGTGMPEALARALADNNAGARAGAWYTDSTDLERIIGRPTTPVSEVMAAALAAAHSRR